MRHYDEEESFHARDRKQFRKERKIIQKLDRSKFKKTDLEIAKPAELSPESVRGRVISITGEGTWVDLGGKVYLCSLKGLLKKEKTLSKNLVAVGDWVHFTPSENQLGVIEQIEERKSILSRTDISGKKEQLIATNVDQAVIITSVVSPPLKPSLIDRYLIAIEKGGLHPVIVINKIDLLESADESENEMYREFLAAYESLGIPIVSMSIVTKVGLEAFKGLLLNKTSVFSGQSGVGKSSLLNACFGLTLKVGDLCQKTFKGSHTTTTAELLPLPGGGYCIDTPGIRSFGVWNLKKEEVTAHFTEFSRYPCKFPDCSHLGEPSCGVAEALEEGTISPLRFASYQTLLAEAALDTNKTSWS